MPTRLRRIWRLMAVLALMAATLAACAAPSVVGHTTPGSSTDGNENAPNIGCGSCSVYTPHDLRAAYGVTPLYDTGKRGQGQTVVLIESYGSPTLKQDLDVFDQQFNLPTPKLTILNPLGTVPSTLATPRCVAGRPRPRWTWRSCTPSRQTPASSC